jgi:hypothetical protein
MVKKPVVTEETATDVTPEVTEEETATDVTPEVTEEEVYISPSTRAEMEAGKAALAKAAESASAE